MNEIEQRQNNKWKNFSFFFGFYIRIHSMEKKTKENERMNIFEWNEILWSSKRKYVPHENHKRRSNGSTHMCAFEYICRHELRKLYEKWEQRISKKVNKENGNETEKERPVNVFSFTFLFSLYFLFCLQKKSLERHSNENGNMRILSATHLVSVWYYMRQKWIDACARRNMIETMNICAFCVFPSILFFAFFFVFLPFRWVYILKAFV